MEGCGLMAADLCDSERGFCIRIEKLGASRQGMARSADISWDTEKNVLSLTLYAFVQRTANCV